MKIKVIKRFYDKTADLVIRKADTEFEATPERAKELIAKGFVKKIDETKSKTTKETK